MKHDTGDGPPKARPKDRNRIRHISNVYWKAVRSWSPDEGVVWLHHNVGKRQRLSMPVWIKNMMISDRWNESLRWWHRLNKCLPRTDDPAVSTEVAELVASIRAKFPFPKQPRFDMAEIELEEKQMKAWTAARIAEGRGPDDKP